MLLGLLIYQSKCPDSIWRLLQRLKIIPTRGIVEKYLKSLPPPDVSGQNMLIVHFDTCDIYRHVTKRYTSWQSDYLHMCTRLVFEVPRVIKVPLNKVWKVYNGTKALRFARKLLIDYSDQLILTKKARDSVVNALSYGGLKIRT